MKRYPLQPGAYISRAVGALGALALAAAALSPAPARSEAFSLEGLTFSDEFGGFRLISVTGRGTRQDPFVVVEEITNPKQAVLVIRGLDRNFGNRIGSQHLTGFYVQKIAVNNSGVPWRSYKLELREFPDHPSSYSDGLSFGQGVLDKIPSLSDKFTDVREYDEPRDSVEFREGEVLPGDKVNFEVAITHSLGASIFYFIQYLQEDISDLPIDRVQMARQQETQPVSASFALSINQ